MADKPTFSVLDDYVALMELRPAARNVYNLLRCNAVFGRNGVATHSVHVTASWFTEMTAHWSNPVTAPTARRGLNELIDKGILIRLNPPQDGTGFVLAFVADPGPQYQGPVNGFKHAERVSKRCGTRAFYLRKDEKPGIPAVTGSRLGSRRQAPARNSAAEKPQSNPEVEFDREEYDMPLEGEFTEAFAEPEPVADVPAAEAAAEAEVPASRRGSAPGVSELTRLLVQKCHSKGLHRQGLLEGEARRIAETCENSLRRGWSPDQIATRLSALVSDKIHSMEPFLRKKAVDLGAPPAATRGDGTVLIKGEAVDLGAYSMNNLPQGDGEKAKQEQAPLPPSVDGQVKRDRLAQLARQARRGF